MGRQNIILGLFLAVGVAMLVFAFNSFQSTRTFLAEAERASGTVVSLERKVSRDSDGNRSVTYYPVVRFTTPSGTSRQFQNASGSNPPAYREGERVDVLYHPDNLADARIDGFMSVWGMAVILSALGLVFSGGTGGTLFWRLRRARIIRRVKQTGRVVRVRLEGVERNRRVRVNGRNPYRLTAQWRNPATGKVHVFFSDNLWFDPSDYLPEDGQVSVMINPDDPNQYWLDTGFLPERAA